jgi:hypothetical protein
VSSIKVAESTRIVSTPTSSRPASSPPIPCLDQGQKLIEDAVLQADGKREDAI